MRNIIIKNNKEIKEFINHIINQNKYLNLKVEKEIEKIFSKIKTKGDKALFNYAKKFDKCNLNKSNLVINKNEINKYAKKCPKDIEKALNFSALRIKSFIYFKFLKIINIKIIKVYNYDQDGNQLIQLEYMFQEEQLLIQVQF